MAVLHTAITIVAAAIADSTAAPPVPALIKTVDGAELRISYPVAPFTNTLLLSSPAWKFSNDVNLESSFDIFSPYSFENVELDWETVGNFVINRYLSTRLSLNLRYDSTPMSTDYDSPKLQIQEQLSFGFNYVF